MYNRMGSYTCDGQHSIISEWSRGDLITNSINGEWLTLHYVNVVIYNFINHISQTSPNTKFEGGIV